MKIEFNFEPDQACEFLKQIVFIRMKQSEQGVMFSNQGQAMDGYSALANYNEIADRIIGCGTVILERE